MFANFNLTMAWYDLVEALERSFPDEAERGHSSGPIYRHIQLSRRSWRMSTLQVQEIIPGGSPMEDDKDRDVWSGGSCHR